MFLLLLCIILFQTELIEKYLKNVIMTFDFFFFCPSALQRGVWCFKIRDWALIGIENVPGCFSHTDTEVDAPHDVKTLY